MKAVAAWMSNRGLQGVAPSANEVRAFCPFHAGDIPTLAVYATGRFVCWSARCGERGNWKELAIRIGGSPPTRGRLLHQATVTVYPEAHLYLYPYAYQSLAERGISAKLAHDYNIRWDTRPARDALLLPSHDEKAQVVGLTWRYKDARRYRHHPGMPRDRLLYGLFRHEGHAAVLVEGFFDKLRLAHFGVPSLSSYGAALTDRQVAVMVASGVTELVVMYDNDLAGFVGAIRAWDVAHNRVDITFAMAYTGLWPKDPGESDWPTLRRLLQQPVGLDEMWRNATERWEAEWHRMRLKRLPGFGRPKRGGRKW